MARATGSINYLEHRTPLKDESGKYQIHPVFVKRDTIAPKLSCIYFFMMKKSQSLIFKGNIVVFT